MSRLAGNVLRLQHKDCKPYCIGNATGLDANGDDPADADGSSAAAPLCPYTCIQHKLLTDPHRRHSPATEQCRITLQNLIGMAHAQRASSASTKSGSRNEGILVCQ